MDFLYKLKAKYSIKDKVIYISKGIEK